MIKKVITRIVSIVPALVIQVLWYLLIIGFLSNYATLLTAIVSVLAFLFTIYIISKRDEGSYKILWLMIMLLFPLLGAVLYMFMGNKNTGRALGRKLAKTRDEMPIKQDDKSLSKLFQEDKRAAQTFDYMRKITGFQPVHNGSATYYPLGEDMFADMRVELEKAEKFIFIEYFIIMEGTFWDTLTEILARKAAAGVDVRVMYDDLGSIATYSAKNVKKLIDKGIKCIPFNPLIFIKGQLNNRDHRKIMVIDGKTAFSGGVNISDEYINVTHPHGHWKDIGFKITGEGVYGYTYMFMEFWNAFSPDKIPLTCLETGGSSADNDGYIFSYYDSPMNDEPASNTLYCELLSQAERYVWFYTPYLMLGDTLMDAFVRAARRGVDVRIIMPGIPDKKLIYRLSRSYYRPLLTAGVKIYEYTPGFVHAKACICDDKIAAVGTVNLDYRSLFLHFECNSVFYGSKLIDSVHTDYQNTLAQCQERTLDNMKEGLWQWIFDGILRIFAPLC